MMKTKKVYFVMLALVIALVALCAGATYFAQKLLVKQGDTLYDLKVQQAVLDKRVEDLNQAKSDISKYEELETIAKSIVPQEKDQARTILEIVNISRESGIDITSINFPASELGKLSAKGKPTGNDELTQLTPVQGLKGVYEMQITVTSNPSKPITYTQLLDYLDKLENNRRTSQITTLTISPATNRNLVTFTLTINSYVKP